VTASGEAADEDFLDDLVDRLSRLRWVRVTRGAPAIEAAYGLEVKWRASALEPHATLVVTDQASGEVLWTGRSRVEAPARAAELRADVAQIDATLDQAEQRRAMNSAADDQDLRTLIAQGRWRLNRLNRRDGDEAKALFDRILAESPENPEGLVQKALAIGWSAWAGREDSEGMRELRALARKAMLADNLDGRGFMLAGIANIWLRNSSAAKVLLRQAVELNPSLVMAWGQLGTCHVMAGEPEEGAEALRLAVDMNPADMHVFYPLGELAMALAMLGRWEEAITWADRSLVRRPRYWYAQLVRIAAFDAVDRPRDAAGAYRELLFETPRFSSDFIDWTPFEHEDWPGELKRRLTRVGGLPDPAPRG
jgi:tetratricopeptide (TPR) repeat protein